MCCGHCVKAVESALRRLAEIEEVKVTLGEAVVTTAGPPNEPQIRQVIEDEGYEVV